MSKRIKVSAKPTKNQLPKPVISTQPVQLSLTTSLPLSKMSPKDLIPMARKEFYETHEVEEIKDSRPVNGELCYFVKWKGCSEIFDSWVPESMMKCPDLIEKYNETLPPEPTIEKIIEAYRGPNKEIYYKVLFSDNTTKIFSSLSLRKTHKSMIIDYLEAKATTSYQQVDP